ncbi:protein of unknown function (plasmid) [Methylocella tundrae]|uniref:Uncharacterized protein n=1 Tax=Methylocella tundrae TaxID=227605 RepID=A0A4U8Z7H8_METTU|nr:protein of unknown function [Methylocella tundrae]
MAHFVSPLRHDRQTRRSLIGLRTWRFRRSTRNAKRVLVEPGGEGFVLWRKNKKTRESGGC